MERLIVRVRQFIGLGLSLTEITNYIVGHNEATPEEIFLAYKAAEILEKPYAVD